MLLLLQGILSLYVYMMSWKMKAKRPGFQSLLRKLCLTLVKSFHSSGPQLAQQRHGQAGPQLLHTLRMASYLQQPRDFRKRPAIMVLDSLETQGYP